MSSTTSATAAPELLSQPRRQVYWTPYSTQLNNSANFWGVARLPLLLSPHLSLVVWGQGEPSALRVELYIDRFERHRVVLGRFDVAKSNLKQHWHCIGDTTWSLMMVVNEAINISHRRPPYCRRRHIWAPDHQTFAEALGDAIKNEPPAKNPDIPTHMLPGRDVADLDYEDTWGNRYGTSRKPSFFCFCISNPLSFPFSSHFRSSPSTCGLERSPSRWTGPFFRAWWAWPFGTKRVFRSLKPTQYEYPERFPAWLYSQ
ncbi:hypothetical protein C8R47DRAFT_1165657 [Mycena vitilis]|nr:hypothetical protein C8R47DRAFT_1165657 [Mycena vitilis]